MVQSLSLDPDKSDLARGAGSPFSKYGELYLQEGHGHGALLARRETNHLATPDAQMETKGQ